MQSHRLLLETLLQPELEALDQARSPGHGEFCPSTDEIAPLQEATDTLSSLRLEFEVAELGLGSEECSEDSCEIHHREMLQETREIPTLQDGEVHGTDRSQRSPVLLGGPGRSCPLELNLLQSQVTVLGAEVEEAILGFQDWESSHPCDPGLGPAGEIHLRPTETETLDSPGRSHGDRWKALTSVPLRRLPVPDTDQLYSARLSCSTQDPTDVL